MPLCARKFPLLILVPVLLAACAGSPERTQDVDAIFTESIGTMVASFFGTQTAMYTPPSPTSTVTQTPFPTPTEFSSPTPRPLPTLAYSVLYSPMPSLVSLLTPVGDGTFVTATVNPSALGSGCNNLTFIRDVTIPPGTVLKPKEDFDKIWKVQNSGTCPWLYQYRLVFLSGEDFGGKTTKIQKKVEINDWYELSIGLTAPNVGGSYNSYWRLADADGKMFGATLAISIEVVE